MSAQLKEKENQALDVLKFIAAIFILFSHCMPLFKTPVYNLMYSQWFFRFCVPLFFISSGYYFSSFSKDSQKKYIKRILKLYIGMTILYFPFNLVSRTGIGKIIKNVLLGYHHLWYLSALFIALCILYFLHDKRKIYPYIGVGLLLIGAFFDEYFKFFDWNFLKSISEVIVFCGGARHAIFFALPMLLVGKFLFEHKKIFNMPIGLCIALVVISSGLSFAESRFLISNLTDKVSCDVTLFNYLPAVFLFVLTFKIKLPFAEKISTKSFRKMADVIYFTHIAFLSVVLNIFGYEYPHRSLTVLAFTVVFSYCYVKFAPKIIEYAKKKLTSHKNK